MSEASFTPGAGIQWLAGYLRQNRRLGRVVLRCVPDWRVHLAVPGAGRMRIRLRRNRSYWLRHPLAHEWYPLSVLKAFVRPGNVVWDVGANIGLYSRLLVTWLGARHVVAFEPMTDNVPELRHNLRIGGIEDRVTVVPIALSSEDGEADFQVDDEQSASGALDAVCGGQASQGRQTEGLGPKMERVACRTVDSLLAEGVLPVPDVIKIDVEGAERLVLDGARRFLMDASPLVVIETHGIGAIRASLEMLFDCGFQVAGCVPESWHPHRHQRLYLDVIDRVADQYDVHFIAAAKDAADLPRSVALHPGTLIRTER